MNDKSRDKQIEETAEYIERGALIALFEERHDTAFIQERTRENREHWWGVCTGLNWGLNTIKDTPTADVVPRAEVLEDIDNVEAFVAGVKNGCDLLGITHTESLFKCIFERLTDFKKKYTEIYNL